MQRTSCVAVSLAINAIAVIWKLLPRKTNILRKIFLSSALDLLTLAVVAGYFFSMAWFMILDVKSRHIRSSPYVPFFHSLCDDCFAEFSSGLLFKSQFHLSYGDLYYKERKTWREQLYFVSLHVYNHVCWLAAVSSEKKKPIVFPSYNCKVFEIHRKSLIIIASEASYVYILSWQHIWENMYFGVR